jgi:hypothetical protein
MTTRNTIANEPANASRTFSQTSVRPVPGSDLGRFLPVSDRRDEPARASRFELAGDILTAAGVEHLINGNTLILACGCRMQLINNRVETDESACLQRANWAQLRQVVAATSLTEPTR